MMKKIARKMMGFATCSSTHPTALRVEMMGFYASLRHINNITKDTGIRIIVLNGKNFC